MISCVVWPDVKCGHLRLAEHTRSPVRLSAVGCRVSLSRVFPANSGLLSWSFVPTTTTLPSCSPTIQYDTFGRIKWHSYHGWPLFNEALYHTLSRPGHQVSWNTGTTYTDFGKFYPITGEKDSTSASYSYYSEACCPDVELTNHIIDSSWYNGVSITLSLNSESGSVKSAQFNSKIAIFQAQGLPISKKTGE